VCNNFTRVWRTIFPPPPATPVVQTCERNRGRLEARCLQVGDASSAAVEFPFVEQVGRLTRCVDSDRNPAAQVVTEYLLCSRPAGQMGAAMMLEADRRYWGIEKGLHLRLDVIAGEDRSRVRHRTSAFTQIECWQALQASPPFADLTPRSRAILKTVLNGKNGIATRHLALEPLAEVFELTPDALLERFSRHAPALASEAGQSALGAASISAAEVDGVIVSTCTGYLCPGLTSYVAERLGLRPDLLALDLVGQGCGAALPNLRTASGLVESGRCEHVLCVCVEVCSAAFYIDNDPGVLISACLFGDGAGAAVVSRQARSNGRQVEWKADGSVLAPQDRDLLRFETKGGMLRNVLSPAVPQLAARHARSVFRAVTERAKVEPSQINGWILHAGGREVLKALQEEFGLPDYSVRHSGRILGEFGNISSPFVLFTLKAALEDNAPGGLWWLASFGAGFSSHGAILEVR